MGIDKIIESVGMVTETVESKENEGPSKVVNRIPFERLKTLESVVPEIGSFLNMVSQSSGSFVKSSDVFYKVTNLGVGEHLMKKKDGTQLGSIVNDKGKLVDSAQLEQVAGVGTAVGANVAKAVPIVYAVIIVLEIGAKIIMNQQSIKEELKKELAKQITDLSGDYENLWSYLNDMDIMLRDDFNRAACLVQIMSTMDKANKIFSESKARIESGTANVIEAVSVMKSSLLVYSFAYLLKIAYARLQEHEYYVKNAVEDIQSKTQQFNDSTGKFVETLGEGTKKRKGIMKFIGYAHGDYNTFTRIAAGITTLGASELVNQGLRVGDKMMDKSDNQKVEQANSLKMENNSFVDCIKSIAAVMENEEAIYIDGENLYYEYSTPELIGATAVE